MDDVLTKMVWGDGGIVFQQKGMNKVWSQDMKRVCSERLNKVLAQYMILFGCRP